MRDKDHFLEQALLAEQRITPEQLEAVRTYSSEQNVDLVDALVQTRTLSGRDLALVKADVCEAPFVELDDYEACFANTRVLPRPIAERYCLFPLFMIDGVLTIATDDSMNLEAMDQVRRIAKCEVDAVICDRQNLRELIARAYSLTDQARGGEAEAEQQAEAAAEAERLDESQPVVAAVNQMLADAVEEGASDIHINPDDQVLRLRYRIDGVLHGRQGPALAMHSGIVQRLKVMAKLDLTQTRRPQDGKFRITHDNKNIEVRVSTIPTVWGENVVLRLLSSALAIHDFQGLGIPPRMVEDLEALIRRPYGLLLVTGPTGCGKTTSLYTVLNKLNDPSHNIMTIEDPVEIRLPYIRQVQVNHEIGLKFASALRSILRQDPDVVLVGEIRDDETANIALQAALTGHLVLSTLHTNDAAGAVARLRDFGLPSFVINSAMLGIVAQRLVRRVCQHCAVPDRVDDLTRRRFGLEEQVGGLRRGKGCGRCGQTGYHGRLGLFEMLIFTPTIQSLVERGAPTKQIREAAIAEGMRLMWQDGLEKARLSQTTLDEVAKAAAVVSLGTQALQVKQVRHVA
jgi:type IV pilus assembly protein PilB